MKLLPLMSSKGASKPTLLRKTLAFVYVRLGTSCVD